MWRGANRRIGVCSRKKGTRSRRFHSAHNSHAMAEHKAKRIHIRCGWRKSSAIPRQRHLARGARGCHEVVGVVVVGVVSKCVARGSVLTFRLALFTIRMMRNKWTGSGRADRFNDDSAFRV